MSEPTVDVREWIREASAAIDRAYGVQAQLPKEAPAVLGAVAELIEAVDAVLEFPNTGPSLAMLRAALARVGGA